VEAAHKAKDLAASETIQRGQYEEGATGERSALSTPLGKPDDRQPVDRAAREAEPIIARIAANPTDPNLYLQLATVYRRHNQLDRARAALEQGLGPTGSHFQIMIEIMEMDIEPFRRNLLITEDKLRAQGRQVDSDDDAGPGEDLRRIRRRLLREINSREIELYRLKADRFTQDLNHRLELGFRLMRADQLDQAIVELQQARKEPKLAGRAAMYLGFCFKRRNNWRLAQRNFEEALAQIPESDEANRKEVLFQLAQGHAEAGDLARALDLGHELANLDFAFRDIGRLLDEWQERLQQA
jgi:Tfp pilus assembly protein PilF